RAADRRDLRLHHLPRLLARLPAPPRPLRRDARADAHQHPQPALLPEPDARDARGDRAAALRGMAGAVPSRSRARPMKRLITALKRAFGVLVALIVLFEEWGWEPLQRLMARIGRLPVLRHIEALIERLPP